MNLQELLAAGFTEDQAKSILAMHKKAIDGNFVPKHRFDEVNGELKTVKEQVSERDTQIKNLKKFEGDSEALSKKLKEMEDANAAKDKEYKESLALEKKRNAIKLALLEDEAGKPHDADMVMGLFNIDQIILDESTGKISGGFKEQSENIRKEKSFLFAAKTDPAAGDPKPAGWKPAGTPPADGDKGGAPTDPSISYGKSLAQMKLSMMGVEPAAPTTK